MSTVTETISTIAQTIKERKLIGVIYLIQLLLAIAVGSKVIRFVDIIKTTLSYEELLYRYDYTILQDLIIAHGTEYSAIFSALWLVIGIYLLVSVFIHGGLLQCVWRRDYSISNFIDGGRRNYFHFLILGLFFMILMVLWSAFIWIPYFKYLFVMVEKWVAEYMIVWLLITLVVIYFIGLTLLFLWSVHARLDILKKEKMNFGSIRRGVTLVSSQLLKNMKISFIYASLFSLIYFTVQFLELRIGITGTGLVITFIVIHQLIICIKIALRISVYTSLRNLHS